MKKCYRCNRQFSDEALMFCPYCGSPLSIDKEWHAEQERKAREKAEAKRKEEEWEAEVAPIRSRYRNAKSRFERYMEDRTFPYKINGSMFYRHNEYLNPIKTLEDLDKLEKGAIVYEDFVDAIENRVDSTNFLRLNGYIDETYKRLMVCYDKMEEFKRSGKYSQRLYDFLKRFVDGGKYEHLASEFFKEESDFDLYGVNHPMEKVSISSISYDDIRKYNLKHDYEYTDRYESVVMEYSRYKVYKTRNYTMFSIDFSYSGIKGKIKNLSSSSPKVGTEIIKVFSDMVIMCEYYEQFTRNYGWSCTKTGVEILKDIQQMNIASFERKNEYKQDQRQFSHYVYTQRMVSGTPKRRW